MDRLLASLYIRSCLYSTYFNSNLAPLPQATPHYLTPLRKISPVYVVALLLASIFSLATLLGIRAASWSNQSKSNNALGLALGTGRHLFANQCFTMADVYFHSGYYPSIFEMQAKRDSEVVETSHGHTDSAEDELKEDFLGKPKDCFDAFGRKFKITEHTHLSIEHNKEILPWLRMSASLDPQKVETYTVGAYFLGHQLGRAAEAETFIREGIRNNPDNPELSFYLGQIYNDNYTNVVMARNIWEAAYAKWNRDPKNNDRLVLETILVHLAHLEETQTNYAKAIQWFGLAEKISPEGYNIRKQINELQAKLNQKL